jgi:DNA repair ATPase RecN
MANEQRQNEQQRADATEVCQGVDVLVTLVRKHDKRLSRMAERLDVHDRRLEHIGQRFDEVGGLFRQADSRFDELDDRFVQVEQRLDFIGGQLAELVRTLAS